MIPNWLVFSIFLVFWIGVSIDWISYIVYEAKAKKDEKIIDDSLNRTYKARKALKSEGLV